MSGDRRGGGAARARNASVADGFSRAFACEGKAIARLKVCVVLLVAAAVTPAYGQSAVVAELRASLGVRCPD